MTIEKGEKSILCQRLILYFYVSLQEQHLRNEMNSGAKIKHSDYFLNLFKIIILILLFTTYCLNELII